MGKYLLEGIKPLADAVSLGISIDTILVREGSSFPLEKVTPEIVLELGAQLFDSIADTEHSQGVIAVIQKKQHDWDSFSNLLKNNTKNIVILDRLQDPGNMGTIIRTAEAAGYGGVLLMADVLTHMHRRLSARQQVLCSACRFYRKTILQKLPEGCKLCIEKSQ